MLWGMDDDLDPLMPIGMFARASLVSIKALRSYHEQGLLVPAETDPTTGYRSYRVSQLVDATVIKRLGRLTCRCVTSPRSSRHMTPTSPGPSSTGMPQP